MENIMSFHFFTPVLVLPRKLQPLQPHAVSQKGLLSHLSRWQIQLLQAGVLDDPDATSTQGWNLLPKGIVQRDLTGVETTLKKSVLLSYSVGKFFL
jgi:hypothetical protein